MHFIGAGRSICLLRNVYPFACAYSRERLLVAVYDVSLRCAGTSFEASAYNDIAGSSLSELINKFRSCGVSLDACIYRCITRRYVENCIAGLGCI